MTKGKTILIQNDTQKRRNHIQQLQTYEVHTDDVENTKRTN